MQSPILSALQNLWKKFKDKEYRNSFVGSHTASNIANQIATLREDRGWTQTELAQRAEMKQARISVLENPSNESVNISTLIRLANAFDVGLAVRFVPHSDIARWAVDADAKALGVTSFDGDRLAMEPITRSDASNKTVFRKSGATGSSLFNPVASTSSDFPTKNVYAVTSNARH